MTARATCPCCGAKTDRAVIVDLMTNTVTVGARSARLRPQAAEVLHVLAGAHPGVVLRSKLIDGLYGGSSGPEDAAGVLHVLICQLHKRIAPLGLYITTTQRRGYVLRLGDKPPPKMQSHSEFLTNGAGA
jgi:DNA-binding winged helix-turn-helix (wHTH) protein